MALEVGLVAERFARTRRPSKETLANPEVVLTQTKPFLGRHFLLSMSRRLCRFVDTPWYFANTACIFFGSSSSFGDPSFAPLRSGALKSEMPVMNFWAMFAS